MRLRGEWFCSWLAFVLFLRLLHVDVVFLPFSSRLLLRGLVVQDHAQDACDVAAAESWPLVGARAAASPVHYVLVLHDQGPLGWCERPAVDVLGAHEGGHAQ